ncbi:MAG TPA: hypothetical protein VFM55_19045 [Micromonosporaceae bacterium]|nr:hypothetical protein [Micromonosporaceae bacterium]
MSAVVWKYEVEANGRDNAITMPKGARILHVEHQDARPSVVTFWAEVDPAAERELRTFVVVGTGHPVPDGARYVGTDCVLPTLVWHLYETTSAVTS